MLYAALKRKAAVSILNLYINTIAMQRAVTIQSHLVKKNIHQILKRIQRARAPQKGIAYKHINQKALCLQATEKKNIKISGTLKGDPAPHQQNITTLIRNKWPPTQVEIYYIYYKMGRP